MFCKNGLYSHNLLLGHYLDRSLDLNGVNNLHWFVDLRGSRQAYLRQQFFKFLVGRVDVNVFPEQIQCR